MTAVAGALPVGDRALALMKKRHSAGVMLPDLARKTGYDIRYLLQVETGALDVAASVYSRISTAITDLLREKNGR